MSNKIKFKDALKANARAFSILFKRIPELFVFSALYAIIDGVIPYVGIFFTARIINELASQRRSEELIYLACLALSIELALAVLKAIFTKFKSQARARLLFVEQGVYKDKMLDMTFENADSAHTHDLRSQIKQNSLWSGWGLLKTVGYFEETIIAIVSVLSGAALTYELFVLKVPESAGALTILNSPIFILVIIGIIFAITLIAPMFANKAEAYWAKTADESKLSNRIFAFFGFMAQERERSLDVRMYNQQEICDKYFKENNSFGLNSPLAKYAKGGMGIYTALFNVTFQLLTGVAYVFVCLKAWGGAFEVGSITQYIGSLIMLSKGVSAIFENIGDMRTNSIFLKTTFEFLDLENSDSSADVVPQSKKHIIEFKNVSFKYPSSENYALKNVSVTLDDRKIALVGRNGSGKTTFIKLLTRLYKPTEGEILLDGRNIFDYNNDEYMKLFSVVFQDFKLVALPLGQNVASSIDYDKQRVISSLEKAGFSDRLEKMDSNLETYLYKDLSSEGVDVSGGEAQKIAIARALYKDAPYVILDEPTAALDPIAEAEIYSKFNDMVGEKGAIYISHRLSSCRFCDEIIVFAGGEILESGTHDKLLKHGGEYAKMWAAQAEYYLK